MEHLWTEVRERVEEVEGINFVYVDVNCDLLVFTSRGNHKKLNLLWTWKISSPICKLFRNPYDYFVVFLLEM